MKSLKQAVIDMATQKVKKMGNVERLGWPPDCYGIYYQPERPKTLAEQQENINANKIIKKY